MKSFVYTVVAATIAASSAAANSTDASTSGTVPAVEQYDYCEFSNVVDGTMTYIPGYYNTTNYTKGAGWWRTHKTGAAKITVKTRGASVISIMGGDVVINRNDGTTYPVKVDYQSAQAVGYGPEATALISAVGNNESSANRVIIEPLPGETVNSMDGIYGGNWENFGYGKVFTTKEDPNYVGNMEWGYNSGYNPTAMTPVDGLVFGGSAAAHDQLNYHLRYTDYKDPYGTGVLPNLEYEFQLSIEGMAWMLGSDGTISYEDDGMGRRDEVGTDPAKPWLKGRKITHYGMTDGDYYIEHTVQCLQ